MRGQKNGEFSVLRGARDEKPIAPFLPDLPRARAGLGLHPQGGSRTATREFGAAAQGTCKRGEGGSWPLPSPEQRRGACQLRAGSGGSPSLTPLRAVIYSRYQWPILFLS